MLRALASPLAAEPTTSGWRAGLKLGFRPGPGRTLLAERQRSGPLAVQRALYPEGDCCHVYLLHPPGGLAGGDRLEIDVNLAEGASALLTTPGATKFYRCAQSGSRQSQTLRLADGAGLEYLPQENILFPGARVDLRTQVELTGNARFIGWEIHCLGRPTIGERFTGGELTTGLALRRDGRPILLERQRLDDIRGLHSAVGLRSHPVFASLLATPFAPEEVEGLREALSRQLPIDSPLALTCVDGLLIARWLGDSGEQARHALATVWMQIRPSVMGREPCAPRIWNT